MRPCGPRMLTTRLWSVNATVMCSHYVDRKSDPKGGHSIGYRFAITASTSGTERLLFFFLSSIVVS